MTEVHSNEEVLVVAELASWLEAPEEPKVFCTASRQATFTTAEKKWLRTRQVKRSYTVRTCSLHEGHDGQHIDVHAGSRFS